MCIVSNDIYEMETKCDPIISTGVIGWVKNQEQAVNPNLSYENVTLVVCELLFECCTN